MKTIAIMLAGAALAVPARAFDGEVTAPPAPGPKQAELATAQTNLTNAQNAVQSATQAEADAKARLAAAETALKGAEGDAKTTATATHKQAKADVAATVKALRTAKSDLKKSESAVKKAQTAADREAAKAAKAKPAREKLPEQNGISRPKADTATGKAWTIFDDVSRANGSPASIGEAMPLAKAQGINEATVRTQYARWRKFNGVSGRIANPTAPAPTPQSTDVQTPTVPGATPATSPEAPEAPPAPPAPPAS